MARKDLLKSLMAPTDDADDALSPAPAPRARYTKGAIGAVSQSIAELRARSIEEVVADQIDPGGLIDRLDDDPQGHEALKQSIRDYGQQVPVLLRHDPNVEGRYQVVFGRRRVAALRDLGQPVKAMIRDLSDYDLIIAQGQENAARKDLTFIEKTNFARQMLDNGYTRKVICDALQIDKTVISRMLAVADAVPAPVIRAIGAAPSVGRDRWLQMVQRITQGNCTQDDLLARLADLDGNASSDQRFQHLFDALAGDRTGAKPAARPPALPLTGADGKPLGHAQQRGATSVLTLSKTGGFDRWLIENIERLHRDWVSQDGETGR